MATKTASYLNFIITSFQAENAAPANKGGSYIKRRGQKSIIVTNVSPDVLRKIFSKYPDLEYEEVERDNVILVTIKKAYKPSETSYAIEGTTLILRKITKVIFPEEREEVEEERFSLVSHPNVHEGGFGFFAALLSEIRELEKEIKEIRDELERKSGDYLLSDLPTLTSIASFLPSLPAIICSCGAVHLPSPRLGWWHTSCPACGNKWKVEGRWVFEGGGGTPPLITPIMSSPYEDDGGDSHEYYLTTISAEKPIVYVTSLPDESSVIEPKENVILVDVGKVRYYNDLLKQKEEKEQKLNKCYEELNSNEWKEYKKAVDDLIKFGGILICEGKCAVLYKNGEVQCYSPIPDINTYELEADIKTVIKYFGGEG
jgi:hypothetical protein